MKLFFTYCLVFLGFFTHTHARSLSLDEAVSRTLIQSPKLKVSWDEVGEVEGLQVQSELLPNPIASYSVENVFGNRNWRGWKSAESRYEIAQLIELGGKRCYRSQSATYLFYAVQAAYEAEKLDVLNDLLNLFVEVAAIQEQLMLAQEQKDVAEEIAKTVSAKVENGKVSLIQQHKAEIALSSAEIDLEKIAMDFSNAKERLSSLWGCSCPDFEWVDWGFYELEVPSSLEECLSDVWYHPELIQAQFEHLSAHQHLHLEKAEAIPDLTLVLGYKTLNNCGDRGLILGASIPLPIFNRNQGNVLQAAAEEQQSQDRYEDLQILLEIKLTSAHKELMRAYHEADKLRSTVLRCAQQSFELASEGYRAGKFEYLDMLDSQRTLFEVRDRYIQALLNFHKSRADIEYLSIK